MKKLCTILPLALIVCFLVGCTDKEAMADLDAMKAQAEIEEQNKALVLRMYEEIDKQNFDFVIDRFAPDARIYGAGGFEPMKQEALMPMFTMWFGAFPDYTHSVEEVIAKGDKVVARCTYTGTHKGEFMGIPPTENTFKYLGIHVWQLKDGKIVEGWALEDMLYLMEQLGMELKPKESAE
ncbi:MAG: ester cyclase [Candidatus Aminicenantes bacterium]|jgi:steroid delta-isomerase-like uncharacterized protein